MPGIKKRKDGRYEVRFQLKNKRISKYTRTLKEAQKLQSRLKQRNFAVAKIEPVKKIKTYTVQQWYNEWIELYKKPMVSSSTIDLINSALKNFLPKFKSTLITELNTLSIQRELNKLLHNRTKERICIYFNAMLQKAEDLNLISKNPFKAVQREQRKKFKNNAFTFDEQCKILEITKNTDIEHEVLIYLMCGCRPHELPPKENFNFENNTITVNGTKNENAKERIIEMSKEFSNYIKPYVLNNKLKSSEYVSKNFIKICKEHDIGKPILYRLRHTFATNHFTLGTPAKYVQHWLGHSSVQMTLDIYTDIDRTSNKNKIIKLYNNFYYKIWPHFWPHFLPKNKKRSTAMPDFSVHSVLQSGSPGPARTGNLSVNSRVLHHWATEEYMVCFFQNMTILALF